MSHVWDTYVIGGVGTPRIFSIDRNFCTNPFFNESTSGWVTNDATRFSRVVNSDAFGEYMGRLQEKDTAVYAEYSYDGAFFGGTFMAAFRIKGSTVMTVNVQLRDKDGAIVDEDISINTTIKTVVLIGNSVASDSQIVCRIYNKVGDYASYVYFDNLYLTEVLDDYAFPQPHDSYMKFEKELYGENKLMVGHIQEFGTRWRPFYYCNYEYLDDTFEVYRQELSEAAALFCIPHNDVDWGFICIWDGDFFRRYPWKKFFGHTGIMAFKGMELISNKPSYQSGQGDLYISEEEYIIG